MRCPYACKTKTEFESWEQTLEDGTPVKGKVMKQYAFQYEECIKEDCGAWYDGRCHYNDNQ